MYSFPSVFSFGIQVCICIKTLEKHNDVQWLVTTEKKLSGIMVVNSLCLCKDLNLTTIMLREFNSKLLLAAGLVANM